MRLRRERKAAGLRQAQLAKLSGVPQSTISKLEREVMFEPRFETLDNLARALQRRGRKIEARQLLPRRQPTLIKGFRSERGFKAKGAA